MNKTGALLFLIAGGTANAFTSTPFAAQPRTRPTLSEDRSINNFAETILPSPTPYSRTSHLSAAPGLEVLDPSYNLALGSLALGAVFGVPGSPLKSKLSSFVLGIPLAIFGLFLAFQTTTLRFTLDDENFALVKSNLQSTGENVVVGGENVWAYNKFVNYDLFPSRSFPILVYFKETQTPEDQWNVGPGEQANSEEAISNGAVPGQVHFFPAIANTEDLIKGFEKHGCAKIE